MVRPKKKFGQHFLIDQGIANRIVDALVMEGKQNTVLEIGAGEGMLTKLLMQKDTVDFWTTEVDDEAIRFLKKYYPALGHHLLQEDALKMNWERLGDSIHIIGNLPYFISSQFLFKTIDCRDTVRQAVFMLQYEVAQRIASKEGSKRYGLLSVLLQAYYDIELLFRVPASVFHPVPKVDSAVVRLTRNHVVQLACDDLLFRKIVKQAFHKRRKTLRNAFKNLTLPKEGRHEKFFNKRAEELSVEDFLELTQQLEK